MRPEDDLLSFFVLLACSQPAIPTRESTCADLRPYYRLPTPDTSTGAKSPSIAGTHILLADVAGLLLVRERRELGKLLQVELEEGRWLRGSGAMHLLYTPTPSSDMSHYVKSYAPKCGSPILVYGDPDSRGGLRPRAWITPWIAPDGAELAMLWDGTLVGELLCGGDIPPGYPYGDPPMTWEQAQLAAKACGSAFPGDEAPLPIVPLEVEFEG